MNDNFTEGCLLGFVIGQLAFLFVLYIVVPTLEKLLGYIEKRRNEKLEVRIEIIMGKKEYQLAKLFEESCLLHRGFFCKCGECWACKAFEDTHKHYSKYLDLKYKK